VAERTPRDFPVPTWHPLMNEAAILAAREDRKKIGQFDLIASIEKGYARSGEKEPCSLAERKRDNRLP